MSSTSFKLRSTYLLEQNFISCRHYSDGRFKIVQALTPFCTGTRNLLKEIQKMICENGDKRAENFNNLEQHLERYSEIEFVFENDEFVALAFIQQENFPANCPRVMSRTFLNPKYRKMDASIRNSLNIPTSLILPRQVEFAKAQGASAVCLSIEDSNKRKFCEILAKSLNRYFGSLGFQENWSLCPGMYQTYPRPLRSCWQNILLYRLAPEFELTLPRIEESTWAGLS